MNRRRFLRWTAAACLPAAFATAQTVAPPALGIVEYGPPPESAGLRAYLAALASFGFSEPGSLRVERRFAGGNAANFPALLSDLSAHRVRVVFAIGHDIAKVAKQVVPAMSVVTVGSEDPVASGLVHSFSRPGGSITGVTHLSPELAAKRLELLRETVAGVTRLAVLWEPAHVDTYYERLAGVATEQGLQVTQAKIDSAADIEPAFAAFRGARAQALFVVPSRLTTLHARRIAELALEVRLPLMAAYANYADAGGLMSYGALASESVRRAAEQTARILNGAKPGDLPFELPTQFELVVNLKAARRLGVTVPNAVLLRASRVIE